MISRKVLGWLALAAGILFVVSFIGWGYSTNWTFRKTV